MSGEVSFRTSNLRCFHPFCTVTTPLFRINAKSQPGIWACREHRKNTDAEPIPKEVDELVGILEGKRRE